MKNQRSKFSLPQNITFLNCAYMSPMLKAVEKAGIRGIHAKRNPASIIPADFFTEAEVLRKEFAKLIRVKDPSRIVIIPSVSYGLASVVRNLPLGPGDRMVIAHEQFPSNYYPWRRLALDTGAILDVVAPPPVWVDRGKKWNERILDAIGPQTKVVALGHVHWADGTRFDLKKIRKRSRDVGAKLVIDGTQSVGALPFDVNEFQPDALICGGYKWLMGPYSIGLAYYAECFDNGVPLEENWINRLGSEDFTGLVTYEDAYHPGALRYEVGERSNFILVPMMLEALRQINAWGPENIQSHCEGITKNGISKLKAAGFWMEDDAFRAKHLFGVRLPQGRTIAEIRERVKKKKISVSFRGEFMRVAPHVYNNAEDMDRLVRALLG